MIAPLLALALGSRQPAVTRVDLQIDSVGGITIDRNGQRALELRASFPKEGGPYPVIVFSHGMYGSGDVVRPLTDEFARHGYVVFAPTHGDSLRYADADTIRGAMRGELDNTASWSERPNEVSLIIDKLGELENKVPGLSGKIDPARVGVGGHSFGAWTTQVVAGMSILGSASLADTRPIAFLVISPHGVGGRISAESMKTMRGPMMMISGDNDRGRFEGDPAVYRRQAFESAQPGDKHLVWIDGAHHNFGGINGRSASRQGQRPALWGQLAGPANPKHVEAVRRSSVAFWDAYLKSDKSALTWITEGGLGDLESVTVTSK